MKILIATGIYPPDYGGPARYAEHLKNEWEKAGHLVKVQTFTSIEHSLPPVIRNIFFFFKIIPSVIWCDFIFALDTFSVGFPATLASRIFGTKILMRTGGDFLWENYVERTGNKVLLKNFYSTQETWSKKERQIFSVTKWTVNHVDLLIFSTEWQKQIWTAPYELKTNMTVLENYYAPKMPSSEPREKIFIGGTRKLVWKNLDLLTKAFSGLQEAQLDLSNYQHEEFMKRMSECYATILVSLGDISPNMILESIRYNKPFIITRENGLMDRIGDIAITVDPLDAEDIRQKVLWLCKKENYDAQVEKIKQFTAVHTWEDIAKEVIDLYKTL